MPKQDFSNGKTVTVFGQTLKVVRRNPSIAPRLPFSYELVSLDGLRTYKFTPFNGLERTN